MLKNTTSDDDSIRTVEFGAHGGPLVGTQNGFVELSVFETNVPPRFRLYFSGEGREILPPPEASSVGLETTRPDGSYQSFTFHSGVDYLESDSDIPEPHEFDVKLTLRLDGAPLSYESKFREEGHSHGHSHGHGHGDHHHDHGSGLWGWFRSTFAHSHSIVDKVDASMESNERGIWALKASLIGLGLTATFQVIIAFMSHSIGLLADTIHNFADAGTSIPLWIAFALAKRGASRRFTYGYGKTEDVAGIIIVLIIFFSACVAAFESILKLLHPQPLEHLWWVAAAAIVGFIGNEVVAVFRIRIGTEIGSAALVADGQHARVDGFTSLAVLIGLFGTQIGLPILDPLVGIGISVAILFIVKDAARAVWLRLIDGIEPEILAKIEHATTHVASVKGVHEVRARWVGHKIYTDVEVEVSPELSLRDAYAVAREVEAGLLAHLPLLGVAVVRVRPSGFPAPTSHTS